MSIYSHDSEFGSLWKSLTTTVGLIVTPNGDGFNVMAAEWSYFVAKSPLHVAIVLKNGGLTSDLISTRSPFTVTLCSDNQAGIADFVGSFSGKDIDKSSSAAFEFAPSVRMNVPWIVGGVLALECANRESVELPGYTMTIGEVLHAHPSPASAPPLVKHGSMHHLGAPVRRSDVVAAAELIASAQPILRVAATGSGDAEGRFHISIHEPNSTVFDLGYHMPNEYGDLFVDLEMPVIPSIEECSVLVKHRGLNEGRCKISTRRSKQK